jgi:hypothetical protein
MIFIKPQKRKKVLENFNAVISSSSCAYKYFKSHPLGGSKEISSLFSDHYLSIPTNKD